jgi:hypothetical protein
MPSDSEILVSPELSQEFRNFMEFCSENSGQELIYFDVVQQNAIEMDAVTLAFSIRHLVRLSRPLIDMLLASVNGDNDPDIAAVLGIKGIQLDKTHAENLRGIIFAFRDVDEPEKQLTLVRALQLMAMGREPGRLVFSHEESYAPPQDGWTSEDFGGDESLLETVRSIEDPHWIATEES